ncbi:hypothetical protein OAA43_01075, partial [bacterium]|nr:hypothetical protein [bacterium]
MISIQLAVSDNNEPLIFGDVIPVGATILGDSVISSNNKFKTYKDCVRPRMIGASTDSGKRWEFRTLSGNEVVITEQNGKLFFEKNDGWAIPEPLDIFAAEWKDQKGTPKEIPIPNGKCDIVLLTIDTEGKLIWASTDNVSYKHPNQFIQEDENYEYGGNMNLFMKLQPMITMLSRSNNGWISETYDSTFTNVFHHEYVADDISDGSQWPSEMGANTFTTASDTYGDLYKNSTKGSFEMVTYQHITYNQICGPEPSCNNNCVDIVLNIPTYYHQDNNGVETIAPRIRKFTYECCKGLNPITVTVPTPLPNATSVNVTLNCVYCQFGRVGWGGTLKFI